MKTNDLSHYSPLNPIWSKPYHDTEGGSGILEVTFFCEGEIVDEFEVTKYIPYSWLEIGPNSIEIEMPKPQIAGALNIEDDIHAVLRKEFTKDYTLNFTK